MVTSDTVLALKRQLVAANKAADAQTCVEVLMRLESEVEATNELLKETQIGVAVNKVAREPCSTDVANLAKGLVAKWKNALGAASSTGRKRHSSDSSALPLSGTPPCLPSPVSPTSPDPAAPPRTPNVASSSPHASTSHAPSNRPVIVTRPSLKRPASSLSPNPISESASKRRKDDDNHICAQPKDDTPDSRQEDQKKTEPSRTHKTDRVDLAAAFSPGRKKKQKKKDNSEAKVTAARVASCTALYDALACDSTASNEAIVAPALEIERAVWSAFPPPEDSEDGAPTAAYKTKLRFLIMTLKGAQFRDYRERIVRSELDAAALVAMTPTDFLTDERKALDEKARLASLQSAQISAYSVALDMKAKAMWRPGGR
ncbi:hypothetical protein JCM3770_005773 [Rhodotorula araucariae]